MRLLTLLVLALTGAYADAQTSVVRTRTVARTRGGFVGGAGANVNVAVGGGFSSGAAVGVRSAAFAPGYAVQQAPVVLQQAPVYVQQQPVVIQQAPVVLQAPQVYQQRQAAPLRQADPGCYPQQQLAPRQSLPLRGTGQCY